MTKSAKEIMKRPSASVSDHIEPSEAESNTVYDRRRFEREIADGDAPTEVERQWGVLKNLGYGQDKEQRKKNMILAWKKDGWSAPLFTEQIKKAQSKELIDRKKLLPWARICVKWGGEKAALEGLADGDIVAVTDPSNPSKVQYCIQERSMSKIQSQSHHQTANRDRTAAVDDADWTMFLTNMALDTVDDGWGMEICQAQIPPSRAIQNQARSPLNVIEDNPEVAKKKIRTAISNLNQLRVKCMESLSPGNNRSAESADFAQKNLSAPCAKILDIVSEYEQYLASGTMKINGTMKICSVVDVKKRLKEDSTYAAQVKATMTVWNAF